MQILPLNPQPATVPRILSRRRAHLFGAVIALTVFVGLLLMSSRQSFPPVAPVLTLELTFPETVVGQVEPIVTTGMFGEGDLVVVRYKADATVVFSYEYWGMPGLMSEPVRVEPRSRHVLRVEMPSMMTFVKPPEGARGRLRLDFDGGRMIDADVPFHGRQLKQVFFGTNPIGAAVHPFFRGMIRTSDGREPAGGPETYFTRGERVAVWLRAHPALLLGYVGLAAVCGLLASWVARARWLELMDACGRWLSTALVDPGLASESETAEYVRARRRSLVGFLAASSLATLCYAWLVTGGTFKFNFAEVFGNFYDYQAASFLQGRLDVPEEAIGGEAFEARGKLYGYFGPTPALLRMPFVVAGVAFGKLSRALMVVYFVACLFATYLLLQEALRLARRTSRAGPATAFPSPIASWIMVGSVGLGSTIVFLGSRGLVFHEAILAGITFALWSNWCALRYLSAGGRWWCGALVLGVLAVHARPPTGLFALTLLGCVALLRVIVIWRTRRSLIPAWHPIGVGVLCVLGFASLNGLAWLKFRTFDPAPLKISRPYFTPGRLEHIDGKSFHLVNIPYNIDTYFVRPNFRFEPTFPWFYLISLAPRRPFPKAKIDLPDHTLAIPYAMPSLFVLATLGSIAATVRRPGTSTAIMLVWFAVVPMSVALLAAVATAQRYTGDFVPFLVTAGTFGLAAIECERRGLRAVTRGMVVVLTLAAIAISFAITLWYQGDYLWGVPEEVRQNFQKLRQAADQLVR